MHFQLIYSFMWDTVRYIDKYRPISLIGIESNSNSDPIFYSLQYIIPEKKTTLKPDRPNN